jgi:hypothetical protein
MRNACGHRRSGLDGLMRVREVVIHHMEGNGRGVVRELFRESLRQSREPMSTDAHGQVLALDVAGAGMLRVGITDNGTFYARRAYGRDVAFVAFGIDTIIPDQPGMVDIFAERFNEGPVIHLKTIGSQLTSSLKTRGHVRDKYFGSLRSALADSPARDEFGVRINGSPGPCVGRSVRYALTELFLFAIAERPDFTDSDALAFQIAERDVLILGASGPEFNEKLIDGIPRHTRSLRRRSYRVPLNQAADDCGPLGDTRHIHIEFYA